MGAIRGVLLVFVSVLLFLAFLIGNTFLTLSLSLNYNNVQTELVSSVGEIIENEINLEGVIEENYHIMELYCQYNSEFVFKEDNSGYTFVIPCDVVSQGSKAIVDYGINSLVENAYYEDYDCGFWDCFEKTGSPFFLISEKAKNYWSTKFYLVLLASLALIVSIFFLVEKKTNLPLIAGSLLAISSLPFIKLNSFAQNIVNLIPFNTGISGDISSSFLDIFSIFFTKAPTVFLISLISGIVILGIGILLKIFGIGFKISNLFSKKDKKISKDKVKDIKQEVSEKKSKKSK